MKVLGKGDSRVVIDTPNKNVYHFEVESKERLEIEEIAAQKSMADDWSDHMVSLGGYDVFPFGIDNDLPVEIRETLSNNHLGPRILKKKKLLNWGQGPQLFEIKHEGEKIVRNVIEDKEVMAWLESWDYMNYLEREMTDFNYLEMCWSKVVPTRTARLGRPKVKYLEHVSANDVRYVRQAGLPDDSPASAAMVGNWNRMWNGRFKRYPLTDWQSLQRVGMHASSFYSFDTKYYTRPDILGVLPWLRRSSAIPLILQALSNNSLNVKFHVKSPASFWDMKREKLEEKLLAEGKELTEKGWEDYKDEIYAGLAKVLASEKNVGKFFTSEKVVDIIGGQVVEQGWELEPIDQKIDKYVEAQISISKRADFAAIAAFGLHAALSNISHEGKSDSGSEQLYALQNHLLTEISLPEAKVTEAVNKAIAINFPGRNVRLGFYHKQPEREEDKSESSRSKNQQPNGPTV